MTHLRSCNNMAANTSSESINGKDAKRQQFTNKQRMDMYAFCVLELEVHSNKVSIKKQQQAIQRVLNKQPKEENKHQPDSQAQNHELNLQNGQDQQVGRPNMSGVSQHENDVCVSQRLRQDTDDNAQTLHNFCNTSTESTNTSNSNGNSSGVEGKTLLQLQQEVALSRKCYSDYQKTQVLTSSMLRDVQKRFAKYYPDSAIPSRTTIKHVFDKCVSHGTVENIKTPRKVTKIPQGDEIEHLLIHEPQLSLRQMAQKLNVSTGTVSRRCKALGLVPESVTLKHQQMASARRQKQIKQLESQTKAAILNSNYSSGSNVSG